MILDKVQHADRYFAVHPRFKAAFEFIAKPDVKMLAAGTYKIQDDDLFVIIAEDRAHEHHARLEAHKKYIDIQLTIDGAFDIGWKSLATCQMLERPYDAENDVMLYADAPECQLSLSPGTFAVFFPDDAHAPNAPKTFVKKAIVKVAL
jgi:YhcH/YjgK/YiaL family protein